LIFDSKHIDNLIARYLTGEASKEENAQLEQWMNSSEENKKYFSDVQFAHDKTVSSHKVVKVNVEKAWENVKTQMRHVKRPNTASPTTTSFNFALWMRIAAIVILTFGISFLLYKINISKSRNPVSVASHNITLPYKLADSSEVFLNRNSKITYSSNFGKKQREVSLSGEAYFNVKHILNKPFIVEAEGTLVKDIGTSFNIKAYAGDSIVEVFVESGQVAFFTKDNPGILINKGEKGTFTKATKTFHKIEETAQNILGYKNKVLVFQDAFLSEVVEKLNSIYQITLKINNEELMNCKITVTFDNENIDAIVGIIAETLQLQLTKTADGYMLDGKVCNTY
jgi:transmembrane sensor